jgi:hypothetical protein
MNIQKSTARPKKELIQLLAAGAGLIVEAQAKKTSDLIELASQAKTTGVTIIFMGMHNKSTSDLIRIASAGRAHVIFEV